MTDVVVRNQTPQHLELHGPLHTLKLAPLQRRRVGGDPEVLYGLAASQARRDQVVDWEPAPSRSTVLRVASACAALGLLTGGACAVTWVLGRAGAAWLLGPTSVLAFLGAAVAVDRGQRAAHPPHGPVGDEAQATQASWGLVELTRDLTIASLQWSAFLLLVLAGIAAPALALWYGTDLSQVLTVQGGRVDVAGGQQAHDVLVVRSLQLVLVVLVSMVPALMFFQFDREKLSTLVDRWLHVVFRLDPSVRTVADVDAKYGRRVEEFLGASLGLGSGRPERRLRGRSPVVVATLLVAIGWIVVLLSVPDTVHGRPASVPEMFAPLLTPVTMAFLGAYFLSVQVALRGFVRGDLKPKTYNVITVRILLAVVLAWALQAVAGDGPEVLAASFLGGVVPGSVLLLLRTAAGRGASADDELDQRSPLTQIDQIDVYERTRLEEEGITSVQALARHDLVDLTLSSRIPAPRLVDWVDQAILQQHCTRAVTTLLRAQGVRCATDLVQVCQDPDALRQLRDALGDGCNPTLLRALLHRDEWLGHLLAWRVDEDVRERRPLRYPLAERTVDLRAHGGGAPVAVGDAPTVHAPPQRRPAGAR
ncbi:MAG: hypothetical protein JWN17_1396 [Frankiales bacterium]|nr:hypothetical protein [Frankiales bacterium]